MGLHCYAVSTHPDELVLKLAPKKNPGSAYDLPPLWRRPQKSSKSQSFYLKNLTYKVFRIFRGFDQLSSSIGRQVMTGQSHWNLSGSRSFTFFAVFLTLSACQHRHKELCMAFISWKWKQFYLHATTRWYVHVVRYRLEALRHHDPYLEVKTCGADTRSETEVNHCTAQFCQNYKRFAVQSLGYVLLGLICLDFLDLPTKQPKIKKDFFRLL